MRSVRADGYAGLSPRTRTSWIAARDAAHAAVAIPLRKAPARSGAQETDFNGLALRSETLADLNGSGVGGAFKADSDDFELRRDPRFHVLRLLIVERAL